jgi:excisionase family DNA binding protein
MTDGENAVALNQTPPRKAAFTMKEAGEALRVGQTKIYALIKTGELRTRKLGRRRLVLADDLNKFLEELPSN